MPNQHEDRARSVKAAKLSRVVEAILAEDASLSVEDARVAGDEFWGRVAEVAGTLPPSQTTRDLVAKILHARLGSDHG